MRSKLLDERFPVDRISDYAAAEKSVRQGHLSTLFFWFARRPTGLCRSAIFAASVPIDIDIPEPLRNRLRAAYPRAQDQAACLEQLVGDLARWDAYRDTELMSLAHEILACTGPGKMIDTFAGGGSIPLEGLRLGLETTASELNPVAAVALYAALVALPRAPKRSLTVFADLVARLRSDACQFLAPHYSMFEQANEGDLLAIFWARAFVCPSCKWLIPLMRTTRLGKGAFLELCPTGDKSYRIEVSPRLASTPTATNSGAICPTCGSKITFADMAKLGIADRLGEIPTAVLVQEGKKRQYRSLSIEQTNALSMSDPGWLTLPSLDLDLNGIRHLWVMTYGVTTTADLFSRRQHHALATLLNNAKRALQGLASRESPEVVEAVNVMVAGLFMRLITYGSRHTWWQCNGEFPANAFGRQALPMVWDFVEIPPTSSGAGGLKSASDWILRAAAELTTTERKAVSVECRDAASAIAPDSSMTLVAIDPPYYDTVTYSYLADCFYPVFRSLLKERFNDWFALERSPRQDEAIVDRRHAAAPAPKDDRHFRRKMSEALSEADRVLKPDGRLLIMYGHKKLSAWIALFSAFEETAFVPMSCITVTSERGTKFQHSKVDHLSTSCLISAEKVAANFAREPLGWEVYQKSLSDDNLLEEAVGSFGKFNMRDPMSRFCAGAALFLGTGVQRSDGSHISIDDALTVAWELSM